MKRLLYKLLALSNDVHAIRRAVRTGSPKPIARRAARRLYGRATGRLAAKWLG